MCPFKGNSGGTRLSSDNLSTFKISSRGSLTFLKPEYDFSKAIAQCSTTTEKPVADLALKDGRAVIRRLGSNTIHVARGLSPDWFVRTTWIGPPYFALHNPTVMLCGAILKPDHRGLVAMQEGTKVTCRRCAHIDG